MVEIVQAVRLFTSEWSAARSVWASTDPRLHAITPEQPVERLMEQTFSAFGALVRSILHQQVSIAAGRSIVGKLTAVCEGTITPEAVLRLSEADLQLAGLSRGKVRYVRALSQAAVGGLLDDIEVQEDEEIERRLIQLPGVGVWTVKMFLLFHVMRPDVFSGGDLGLREAIRVLDGLEAAPTPREAELRAEVWRPYRSVAAVSLWDFLRRSRETARAARLT